MSLLILGFGSIEGGLLDRQNGKLAIALALFTTSVVLAIAAISNDNLQDLKTGYLVGATPWRQQVALIVGCIVGALVIPPVLELLYSAYGFTGALPREGMDPGQALAAPQATLMTAIASGIFHDALNWNMILIGVALGIALILVDLLLRRTGKACLPVLAVGLGIYLPPTIGMTLVVGALISWLLENALKKRAAGFGADRRREPDGHPARRGDRRHRRGRAAGAGRRRLRGHRPVAGTGGIRRDLRAVLPASAGALRDSQLHGDGMLPLASFPAVRDGG